MGFQVKFVVDIGLCASDPIFIGFEEKRALVGRFSWVAEGAWVIENVVVIDHDPRFDRKAKKGMAWWAQRLTGSLQPSCFRSKPR